MLVVFTKEVFSHSLSVCISIREASQDLVLILHDVHEIQIADLLVALIPVNGRFVEAFLDEALPIALSVAGRHVAECLEVGTLFSQTKEL